MHSQLLEKHGIKNFLGGADYDFRYTNPGNDIRQEFERALGEMGESPKVLYTGHQVHGTNVAYCDGKNGTDFLYGKTFDETDGLMTDKENIALAVKFADCTPIILFDPVNRVHACLHSGWRSTVQQISKKAIQKMVDHYGSKREDLLAFVGPSIDQANYEVGPEVYEAFKDFSNRDAFFKSHRLDKYLLSMTEANYQLLKDCGLKDEHIEVSTDSTWTDDRLHSSRQEGSEYQLNALITIMK